MPFYLSDVVPWGRSFDEYVAMFALCGADLGGYILGCGDGLASFNAIATRRGHNVVSVDPIYRFSTTELELRVEEAGNSIAVQLRKNTHEFIWTRFRTVEELICRRIEAMKEFLADLPSGIEERRYVDGSVLKLPFVDQQFDLALCSHFLFLYSQHLSLDFHIEAILELCRVAKEVRIFPLLELGALPSRYLNTVCEKIEHLGYRTEREEVDYEFQKGGNQMLRVSRFQHVLE